MCDAGAFALIAQMLKVWFMLLQDPLCCKLNKLIIIWFHLYELFSNFRAANVLNALGLRMCRIGQCDVYST